MSNNTSLESESESSTPVYSGGSVEINDQLRDVLMMFTATFLVEEPDDIINFAVDFFKRMQSNRQQSRTLSNQSEDEFNSPLQMRRLSVFAEPFDPMNDESEDTTPRPKSDEQRVRLSNAVKDVLLFRSLDCEQIPKLMDAMFEKRVSKGEYIISQGDDGDNFYVIEEGIFKVIKNGVVVHTYNNSGVFGELALMYNQPRAASVLAETDGLLWAIDRSSFRHIVLRSAYKQRKTYEDLINSVPMLKVLQEYERMTLADALVSKRYVDGEAICKQGSAPDGMYFIEEGTVRIAITYKGKEIDVTQLGRGEYFGERALVTQEMRAGSAYAVGNVKLAFLDKESFTRILGFLNDILKKNEEVYEERWKTLLRLT